MKIPKAHKSWLFAESSVNQKTFLIVSLIILFVTTVYWAVVGSKIQNNNADQLIDPMLFSNFTVFQGAIFPSAHTFLLKWPFFALIATLHNHPIAIIAVTTVFCVATVAGLMYIVFVIEKRPVVLGLIALLLASVLLMVPVEPRIGALLPTNFAMLTTRNIEYIFFALGIIFAAKPGRWRFVASFMLLTVLFASDRLFMMLGVGSVFVATLIYLALGHRYQLKTFLRIFFVMVAATIANYLLLVIIDKTGITNISNEAAAPYSVGFSVTQQAKALFYGVSGVITNFGANPLYDLGSWKDSLGLMSQRLMSVAAFAYVVNAIGLVVIIICGIRLAKLPKTFGKRIEARHNRFALLLSLLFTSAAIVAGLLFVLTDHFYPVDARYLTIFLIAGLTVLATYTMIWWKRPFVANFVWLALSISIGCGIVSTSSYYHTSTAQYRNTKVSNDVIRGVLKQHPVKTLIGDYWRVVPIASSGFANLGINPLSGCTTERPVLTSEAWKQNTNQSFAYLLIAQGTGTGFPGCSLQEIEDKFGTPTRTTVIRGQLPNPDEMLLFYDNGVTKSAKKSNAKVVRNIDLIDTKQCQGQTVMQFVAHQDDDLLFMNPDLYRSLVGGDCVRTVYFTAGDSGQGNAYWIGREDGAMAAYANALGINDPHWETSNYELTKGKYATVARLKESNGKVTLYFLGLPDGGLYGDGFAGKSNVSLKKLNEGNVAFIDTVDGQSKYTKDQLIETLSFLLNKYQPSQVRIQSPEDFSENFFDHKDHIIGAQLTKQAFERYASSQPDVLLTQYVGYAVQESPDNLSEEDIAIKKQMFYTYGLHDGAVCMSDEACQYTVYPYFLTRQYTAGH